MIYRVSILSNAFTHIMKCLKEKERIVEMYANRCWMPEKNVRIKVSEELNYIFYREDTIKRVEISKRWRIKSGKGTTTRFLDFKKTLEWLSKQEVPDLPVSTIGFLTSLSINEKEEPVLVQMKHRKAMEDYTRRDCMEIMRHHIDNLGFQVYIFDLSGIYRPDDVERKYNLLEQIMDNKQKMLDITDKLLNQSVNIDGVQKKIRCIRGYEVGERRTLVLKDYEKF